MECEDFLQFQDVLKKMREMDDKIIYILNSSLPTPSFKTHSDPSSACQDLHNQLDTNYNHRSSAITKCIHRSAECVRELKTKYEADAENMDLFKNLKKEQNKLRMLKTEVNVEEVLKQRTMKVFYERCRTFYKPTNIVNAL